MRDRTKDVASRKVVVSEFVSLDGVMEDPSWESPFRGEEQEKFKFDELAAADALLLGRKTYEGFAAIRSRPQIRKEMTEMGNVVIDMSMSLDGYIAAPNDVPGQGLGEDGMRLHNWAFDDPSVFERGVRQPARGDGRCDHGSPVL